MLRGETLVGTIQDISEFIKVACSGLPLLMKGIKEAYEHAIELRDLQDIRRLERAIRTLLDAINHVQFLNQGAILPTIEQLLRSDNKSEDSKLSTWRSFLPDVEDTMGAIWRTRQTL